MNEEDMINLLQKYQAGNCTEEERRAVEQWYSSYERNETSALSNEQHKRMLNYVMTAVNAEDEAKIQSNQFFKTRWVRWAAAVLILVGLSSLYFLFNQTKQSAVIASKKIQPSNDLLPGANRATLTLDDGSIIQLDDVKNGTVAVQGGVKVQKNDDGKIVYTAAQNLAAAELFNIIKTPRGGQFQLDLPDGSKVWLNASSSLRFPVLFAGKERTVELNGEAYFEVAKKTGQPFKVKINGMEVNVLGTHFNVMGYQDEDVTKTTLLEGAVKIISNGRENFLKPGQQAAISLLQNIQVNNVNTEEAVAWKNNLFSFNHSNIQSVMRQVARWYDVDVQYNGTVKKFFNGTIPRDMNASKVFKILEATGGVHFQIAGNKVTVIP